MPVSCCYAKFGRSIGHAVRELVGGKIWSDGTRFFELGRTQNLDRCSKSLKVIGTHTDQWTICDFLLEITAATGPSRTISEIN